MSIDYKRRYSAKSVKPELYGEVKVLDKVESFPVEKGMKKKTLTMKTVKPSHFEPGFVYAPYVPLQVSPSFMNPVVKRTPGRFPLLLKEDRERIIPTVGTLVRAMTGTGSSGSWESVVRSSVCSGPLMVGSTITKWESSP